MAASGGTELDLIKRFQDLAQETCLPEESIKRLQQISEKLTLLLDNLKKTASKTIEQENLIRQLKRFNIIVHAVIVVKVFEDTIEHGPRYAGLGQKAFARVEENFANWEQDDEVRDYAYKARDAESYQVAVATSEEKDGLKHDILTQRHTALLSLHQTSPSKKLLHLRNFINTIQFGVRNFTADNLEQSYNDAFENLFKLDKNNQEGWFPPKSKEAQYSDFMTGSLSAYLSFKQLGRANFIPEQREYLFYGSMGLHVLAEYFMEVVVNFEPLLASPDLTSFDPDQRLLYLHSQNIILFFNLYYLSQEWIEKRRKGNNKNYVPDYFKPDELKNKLFIRLRQYLAKLKAAGVKQLKFIPEDKVELQKLAQSDAVINLDDLLQNVNKLMPHLRERPEINLAEKKEDPQSFIDRHCAHIHTLTHKALQTSEISPETFKNLTKYYVQIHPIVLLRMENQIKDIDHVLEKLNLILFSTLVVVIFNKAIAQNQYEDFQLMSEAFEYVEKHEPYWHIDSETKDFAYRAIHAFLHAVFIHDDARIKDVSNHNNIPALPHTLIARSFTHYSLFAVRSALLKNNYKLAREIIDYALDEDFSNVSIAHAQFVVRSLHSFTNFHEKYKDPIPAEEEFREAALLHISNNLQNFDTILKYFCVLIAQPEGLKEIEIDGRISYLYTQTLFQLFMTLDILKKYLKLKKDDILVHSLLENTLAILTAYLDYLTDLKEDKLTYFPEVRKELANLLGGKSIDTVQGLKDHVKKFRHELIPLRTLPLEKLKAIAAKPQSTPADTRVAAIAYYLIGIMVEQNHNGMMNRTLALEEKGLSPELCVLMTAERFYQRALTTLPGYEEPRERLKMIHHTMIVRGIRLFKPAEEKGSASPASPQKLAPF